MSKRVMIVYPQFMDCELKTTNYVGQSYVFTDEHKGWDFQEYLNEHMDLSGLKGKGQLLWTNNFIEIDLAEEEWDKVVEDWSFPKVKRGRLKR